MKIAGFRPSRRAYDFLRCFNFMKEWGQLGHSVKYSLEGQPDSYAPGHFDYELENLGKWCDVLFTTAELVYPQIAEKVLEIHSKYGFKLVCDNDDPLSIVESASRPAVESLLRGANLVTFVSNVMAEDYGHMPQRYIVQPTCMSASSFDIKPLESLIDAKKTNLIFMGWPYHRDDIAIIRKDIEALLDGGKFRLVIIGVWDKWLEKYDKDTVARVPYVRAWDNLIAFMKGIPRSLAIVPIRAHCQDTRYNNNAKFLDYTAAGVPMIVSDVFNSAFLTDGVEIVKAGAGWANTIRDTARNDVLKKRLCKNARQRVIDDFLVEKAASGFLGNITKSLGMAGAVESAL